MNKTTKALEHEHKWEFMGKVAGYDAYFRCECDKTTISETDLTDDDEDDDDN